MKRRKVWTEEDNEALRYFHGCRYTDGRIARKLECSRRTILRQREAIGLSAVEQSISPLQAQVTSLHRGDVARHPIQTYPRRSYRRGLHGFALVMVGGHYRCSGLSHRVWPV